MCAGSSLRSPAEGEGNEGFPPPPDKDLESPSSTRFLRMQQETLGSLDLCQ